MDTDSDGVPDTFLPGTSNFVAGWPSPVRKLGLEKATLCPIGCHCSDSCGIHCPVVAVEAAAN